MESRNKVYRCVIVDTKKQVRTHTCRAGETPAKAFASLFPKGKAPEHMYGSYAGQDYLYGWYNNLDYYLYLDGLPIRCDTFTAYHITGTLTPINKQEDN